jgi:hypothetical protein
MPGIIKKPENPDESFNKVTQTEDWVSIDQDLDYSQVLSRVDSQTHANNNLLSDSAHSLLKTLQTEKINANPKPMSPESDFKEPSPPKLPADEIISEKQVPSELLGTPPQFSDVDVSGLSQFNEDFAIPNEPKPSQPMQSSPKLLGLRTHPPKQALESRLLTPKIVTCCTGNLLPAEGVGYGVSAETFCIFQKELPKCLWLRCWDCYRNIPINLAVFPIMAVQY